jgi:hypothetical protein
MFDRQPSLGWDCGVVVMETGFTPRSVSMLENDRCLSWFSQFDSCRRSRMCVCGCGERRCSGESMGNVD